MARHTGELTPGRTRHRRGGGSAAEGEDTAEGEDASTVGDARAPGGSTDRAGAVGECAGEDEQQAPRAPMHPRTHEGRYRPS
ncbi:hypothetical protein MBT42_24685 [Streptomyces sp. MBT42]|uniref:hypothetical protein n=1 Tax=Streptomyces sp. MBT42 TaxID=1488373 RepID=UPI001E322BB3|nr:hypothetical protein [Streptomyces sp. MBT42]MCD2466736.1 hypothetical protein [Streptomyces sp. MBT42]